MKDTDIMAIDYNNDGDIRNSLFEEDESGMENDVDSVGNDADNGYNGLVSGVEVSDLDRYVPISDKKGFNGSRHDFKRTKPLFTDMQFKAKPIEYRIGAILSDGQWYDTKKLKIISKADSLEEVQTLIDRMIENDELIPSDSGESYRMTYSQMYDWRKSHNIPMDAQIVQSILYPRVITIGNKSITEQEVFIPVKRHRCGSVKFVVKPGVDMNQMKKDLAYVGRFMNIDLHYKWSIMCLSADWAKKVVEQYELDHGGRGALFEPFGRPTIYNTGFQRDLNEINPCAIEQIVRFYQTFQTVSSNGELRPALLQPSSYRTLKVYLDDGAGDSGVMSQLNKWIIDAIQHYDERCGSPFAAYLQMLANRRVNDIPKTVIGRELSDFQNNKSKAVKALNKKHKEGDWYTPEQIIEEIHEINPDYEINVDKYNEYDNQLKMWQQMKHTTGLQWDETGEEKRFAEGSTNASDRQGMTEESHEKNASSSRIQHAIIHAAVLSGCAYDARIMLTMLNNSSSLGAALMSSMSSMLSDAYRDALAISLSTLKQ